MTVAEDNQMTPKILFFGDVHGSFAHVIELVEQERPDAIVFLGDLECQRPLEQELEPIAGRCQVRFIHGNHDTDSREQWHRLENFQHLNLHGRVETIAGVRIAGLGGVFRGKIWYPPEEPRMSCYAELLRSGLKGPERRRLNRLSKMDLVRMSQSSAQDEVLRAETLSGQALTHLSTIFPDVYERLAGLQADVLVTHEAPGCHPHGWGAIDDLARQMGVQAVFHGHHHDRLNYEPAWPSLGFKVFGVGFRGCVNLYGGLRLAGDFDWIRQHREVIIGGQQNG